MLIQGLMRLIYPGKTKRHFHRSDGTAHSLMCVYPENAYCYFHPSDGAFFYRAWVSWPLL